MLHKHPFSLSRMKQKQSSYQTDALVFLVPLSLRKGIDKIVFRSNLVFSHPFTNCEFSTTLKCEPQNSKELFPEPNKKRICFYKHQDPCYTVFNLNLLIPNQLSTCTSACKTSDTETLGQKHLYQMYYSTKNYF